MGARGASELCTLIEARLAEFNHVNVATAFRMLLQSRRDGGSRGVVERAMQALEAATLQKIDAFRAQEVSNTLHIMAKSRYRPWDRAIKVKTHASTECADAVDQGADACKQGVCSRGRSR